MPHHKPLGGLAPVKGIMVDVRPLKKKWRELAESKARVKGLRSILKEGIGVGMVESFVKNLEEQTRVGRGQSKEDKEIVKWSMTKIVKDSKVKLSIDLREQERLRQSLKETVGPKSAKFKRMISTLNKEAQEASSVEAEKYKVKSPTWYKTMPLPETRGT